MQGPWLDGFAQPPFSFTLLKKMEIEDVVSVIRVREGAVRGYGPVAGGLGAVQVTLTQSVQAGFTLKRRHKL